MNQSPKSSPHKSKSKTPRRSLTPALTVCIGRDKEFEFLAKQFEKPSSATLIYGDPKIGKSELLRDIERIHHPDKKLYVGLWECVGSEDALLYSLARLLEKLHKGPLKDQADVLWSKIKESFASLETFNDFATGLLNVFKLPGSELPGFLKRKFKLEVDPTRTPLLNREIFLAIVDRCQESIKGLKLIFLLDNLSSGFQDQPTPPQAYNTLRSILEKIRERNNLHLVASWMLDDTTFKGFNIIMRDFTRNLHQHLHLGPIEDKARYKAWLLEECRSFESLGERGGDELLIQTGFLPMVGKEWITQEGHREGTLSKQELEEIARQIKKSEYEYLTSFLKQGLMEIVYQVSVLPSNYGLNLHQIAELVPMVEDSKICQCGLKGPEQSSFIEWQTECQRNLEQAVEIGILKAEGEGVENRLYFFDHETKRDYIRRCVQATPKSNTYLQRAFDFSVNHVGFPTKEHPNTEVHFYHFFLLLRQLPDIFPELADALEKFSKLVLANFENKGLLRDALHSQGFSQLPLHLRAICLSEGIKCPEFALSLMQMHKDLLAMVKEDLTYFQTHSIANSLANATLYYSELADLTKMAQCLEGSEKLYQTHPTPEVAGAYAKSLSYFILTHMEWRELTGMAQYLERSEKLYQNHPAPEVAGAYAASLSHATLSYGESGDVTEMAQCLERSEKLYQTHPTPEVVRSYAASLSHATLSYGESGDVTEMAQCLEGSEKLYQTHPTPEVAEYYAHSLTHATGFYGKSGELTEMAQCLEGSEKLYQTHPTPEVARSYADSLSHAIFPYGVSGDVTEMVQCLERSEKLYQTHPTPEVAEYYAHSLTHATGFYGKSGELTEMAQCLERSGKLYQSHFTLEVAEYYANSLAYATAFYGQSGKQTEIEQCLERMEKLYEPPSTPEMAVCYANSLVSATAFYGQSGKQTEIEQCLERMEKLYQIHPTPEVAENYAYSLANASIFYGQSGKQTEIEQCLERSGKLYQTHTTQELAQIYPKVLSTVIDFYRSVKDERANEIAKQLEDFLKDKPEVADAIKLEE